jgi:putative OPT family oligopeptide transporter
LNLLAQAYGIGVPTEAHPNPLLAPQANLMASVAQGIFGGELPWTTIGIGAAIGVAIIALDEMLKRRDSTFRVPVLACAVGIYLPIEVSVPIFAGGLVAHFVERHYAPFADASARELIHQKGTLFAAGLITGEALMGIFIAIPIVMAGRADVLALGAGMQFGGWLGLAMLAGVAFAMYRLATRQTVVT